MPVNQYIEALEAEMQRLGYDTFRRKDENGLEHICFFLPVNDNGDNVFAELSVFGMNDYYFCLQLHSTVAAELGDKLPELEKAVGLWNENAFGTYGIYYARQNLYHRQINVLDADDSPKRAARLALYVLALVREEINSRLPDVLNYITVQDDAGDSGDVQ